VARQGLGVAEGPHSAALLRPVCSSSVSSYKKKPVLVAQGLWVLWTKGAWCGQYLCSGGGQLAVHGLCMGLSTPGERSVPQGIVHKSMGLFYYRAVACWVRPAQRQTALVVPQGGPRFKTYLSYYSYLSKRAYCVLMFWFTLIVASGFAVELKSPIFPYAVTFPSFS
jgi:hypothetical protein